MVEIARNNPLVVRHFPRYFKLCEFMGKTRVTVNVIKSPHMHVFAFLS